MLDDERCFGPFHPADLMLIKSELFFPHSFCILPVAKRTASFSYAFHKNRIPLVDIRAYFQIHSRFIDIFLELIDHEYVIGLLNSALPNKTEKMPDTI
jgi:hypothetical protein